VPGRDAERRAQLIEQQVRTSKQLQPQSPHAQRRVGLGWLGQRRQRLIGADVERSQDHRPPAHRRGHGFEDRDLLIFRREAIGTEEKKLAPQQTDPIGAGRGGSQCILDARGVASDLHPATVASHRRLGVGGSLRRWLQRGDGIGGRIDHECPLVPIEQDRLTIFDRLDEAGDADHRGKAQGSSQNRRVGGGASLFRGKAEHERPVEPRGLRGREIACDEDRWSRRRWWCGGHTVQRMSKLIDDVLDIGRTCLEYWIGRGA